MARPPEVHQIFESELARPNFVGRRGHRMNLSSTLTMEPFGATVFNQTPVVFPPASTSFV